jgi:hypothetical protein
MVVLKSKLSGYYFRDFGVWTVELAKAATFANEWVARAFAHNEHVEDVQVVEPCAAAESDLNAAA